MHLALEKGIQILVALNCAAADLLIDYLSRPINPLSGLLARYFDLIFVQKSTWSFVRARGDSGPPATGRPRGPLQPHTAFENLSRLPRLAAIVKRRLSCWSS